MTATAGAGRLGDSVGVGRRVIRRIRVAEVPFLAASIAYYALLSLLPAMLLLLAVASAFVGDAVATALVSGAGDLLNPAGEAVVREAFEGASGRGGATLVGIAVLLWTALRVLRGLDVAFSKVYGIADVASLGTQIRNGLAAALGIGAGLAVMVAAGWAVAVAEAGALLDVLGVLVLPGVLTLLFLPLYYVFPGVDVSVREVLPGAVLAALGWTVLQAGFQFYAAAATQYSAYGVLGGVLLLVTWFYVAAIVLLSGAAVNVVLAGRDHRQVQQGSGPQSFTDMDREGQSPGAAPSGRTADADADVDADAGRRRRPEDGVEPSGAPDVAELAADVDDLRADFDDFAENVRERTVERPALEAELKRYVRRRMRRGHARGWGPYLVLLYGTVLTLGAFYFLSGIYAIAAMVVLFLSTLGLYTLFVLVGVGLNALSVPGRARDWVQDRRE